MSHNIFNSVKMTKPSSNVFDLSHDVKFDAKSGQLLPVCVLECLPGDKFNIGAESLIRMAPMVAPVMHRFDATIHYFFVPNRLLWLNWENYITNTKDGTGVLPAFPTITFPGNLVPPGPTTPWVNMSSLANYLGLPTQWGGAAGPYNPTTVSALPFFAYQLIWNEYYRDQNLQEDFIAYWGSLNDGDNSNAWFNPVGVNIGGLGDLRNRAWEHDYFTSALPWAQKGDVVDIPLGAVALNPDWLADGSSPVFQDGAGVPNLASGAILGDNTGVGSIETALNTTPHAYNPDGSLVVDSTTINDLRRAFRLQEWLEKNARGGTRYIENILAHFGVKSSDARLQRPEYITGVKTPISISEVLNTSDTTDAPQGNMAGHGVAVVDGKHGFYKCEEHGYIMGIMSILPKPAYSQGIPKHFLKIDHPTDFAFPSFANIGEQPILNAELFAYDAAQLETFGYTPRYAEYKYQPNRVLGQFSYGGSLDFWTATRFFDNLPVLNSQFIEMDGYDIARIFAVTAPESEQYYVHVFNKIKAVRLLPKYGTPSF